jgi:O-antigen/teichoic acid export membrane protein
MKANMPSVPKSSERGEDAAGFASSNAEASGVAAARLHRMLKVMAGFFFGQGTLQGVNILIGLFLVRALSVEQYAQFGLAFGFQTTALMLMDLGYASTIIPLVGDRVDDRGLVGGYLRAAKHLRDKAFLIMGPFAAIAFLGIMHKHHWSWTTQIILMLSVLLTLYSSGPVSYYSAPLFLYRRLREFYIPQTLSGLGRLLACIGLEIAGALNACTAACLSALNVLLNAILLGRRGRAYVEWPKTNQPKVNQEVLKYILPAVPTFIFAAFQSQIALFLINAFGRTVNVAEVAALGKLAQLFAILMSFNMIVIEPKIARLSRERLLRVYLQLILVACGFCLFVVALAFSFPPPFIWVIGPKYRDLRDIAGWVILAGCFNYIANLIWIMNRARKWIFWRGTIVEIVAMLSVDICFVALIGVRTTRQAILFTVASSASAVCTHSYIGIYGFLRGDRKAIDNPPESLEPISPI